MNWRKPFLKPAQVIWTFYFLSLSRLVEFLSSYPTTNFQAVASSTKPLFAWVPDDLDVNDWVSFVFPLLLVCVVFIFPFLYLHFVRVLWFVFVFLIEGFSFQLAGGNDHHLLVWVSLILAFYRGALSSDKADEIEAKTFIRVCQWQIFLIYGLAGSWKLFGFVRSFWDRSLAVGVDYIPYALASEFLNSNTMSASSAWISEHPWICFLLSVLVLVGQLGSIVVIFFPRCYLVWGFVLALFHIGTLLTVNVSFASNIPLIILFLCLSPMRGEGAASLFKRGLWIPLRQ